MKSILAVAAVILVLTTGCAIRKLQPPQYGTQLVQQTKLLGVKMVLPSASPVSGTVGGIEFALGYVTTTTLIIPVVSNVDTNGVVSSNKAHVSSAPLATSFGVSDVSGSPGIKISDNIVSGYENAATPNMLIAVPALNKVGLTVSTNSN